MRGRQREVDREREKNGRFGDNPDRGIDLVRGPASHLARSLINVLTANKKN